MGACSARSLAFSVAILLGAGPAAAELQSASLAITFEPLGAVTFVGNGSERGASLGPLSATLSPGDAFAGVVTVPLPPSAAPPISQVQLVVRENDRGVFRGATPSAVGGPMAIRGRINVRGFGGLTLIGVPLSLGVHNTLKTGAFGIFLTASAAPWTAGVASVTGITRTAATPAIVKSTARATGSNSLTAGGAGTLNLVTPVKIITNIGGNIPTFGKLSLRFGRARACEGKPLGTVCRTAAGPCDQTEVCDGVSSDCPRNQFLAGIVCRPARDEHDLPELCDGSRAACPADQEAEPARDGDGLADGCALPADCPASLNVCSSALAQATSELLQFGAELGVFESQFGQCATDLSQAEGVLGQCRAELAECIARPSFEDGDGDGEHDATDRCPGTPPGREVDDAGCSLAQFCRAIDPNTSTGFAMCRVFADWKGDEVIGKDCALVLRSRQPLRWGCAPR